MTDGLGFQNALSFSGHTNHAERAICTLPTQGADHTSAFQIPQCRLFQAPEERILAPKDDENMYNEAITFTN